MKLTLRKISTLKFAGIHTMLGIDLHRDRARVVELKSTGGIVDKFRATYGVVIHFSLDFPSEFSAQDKGTLLSQELKQRGVRTHFCVASIRSAHSRTVETELPNDLFEDPRSAPVKFQTWIAENYEKLIRVPIPLNELCFSYDVLSVGPETSRCEIAFVRTSERDEVVNLINAAGLHLLALGLGARDSETASMTGVGDFIDDNRAFIFADEDETSCRVYQRGKPIPWKKLGANTGEEAFDALRRTSGTIDRVLVGGPASSKFSDPSVMLLSPLDLPIEYTLAVGLAIRGFLPEVGAFDFRPDPIKMKSTEEKDKTLLKTTVLALGSLLFILLAFQFLAQSYIESASDKLDEKLSQVGPIYFQVNTLRHQVDALEMQIDRQGSVDPRSDVAKALHEIAEATPNGVWLYKLSCVHDDNNVVHFDVLGYSRTNVAAASYLGELQGNPNFSNVAVIRVGAPTQNELASFNGSIMKSFVTFEVKLDVHS